MWNLLQNKSLILFLCLSILILFMGSPSCSGRQVISSDSIYNKMKDIRLRINRDRSYLKKLPEQKIGRSGYFYIINTEGKIVSHPQKYLIDKNFGNNPFVRQIIEKKSGCYRYKTENFTQLIFYEMLNEHEILCLSIMAGDLSE